MIDITDHEVDVHECADHKAVIDGEEMFLSIPEKKRRSIYLEARGGMYSLYEKVVEGEDTVPHVLSGSENVYYFQYVVKKLYNHMGITVSMPEEGILCCPDMRVNPEVLKEIQETFQSICREKEIDYTPRVLKYIPLSAEIICYKDGSEVPEEAAIAGDTAIAFSSLAKIATSSRRKLLLSAERKNAVCDSILLSKNSKITDKVRAAELISLISIDRSRDMFHFLSIGRCLYNIFKGESGGLDLWMVATVSQRHDLCHEYWPVIGTTSTLYTIRYLQYCAKRDNPKEYKRWNSTSVRAAIEESVLATGGILDVATAGYRIDPTLYVSEGDNYVESTVYKFNGTYYVMTGENDMRNYVDKMLIREYKVFLRELAKTVDETPENSVKTMLQGKMDKTVKIISSLKEPGYQFNVVKVMVRLYNIPTFSKLKNANRNVLVFEDCMFDTEKKEIRQGIPEDYMIISTEYTFMEEWSTYSWDHELVKLTMEHLKKILHEPEKLEWFLDLMSKRVRGNNNDKRGVIMYGYNNNAKSNLCTLGSKAFGKSYFPDVPSNLLYSEDTHPGAATPQWQMVAYARLIAMSEVSDVHVLNEGNYKKLTGSTDPITCRGLYSKRIESFIPTCVPITVCNTRPKMNGNSAALRNRIVILHLTARFVNENNVEWEEIKDMEPEERESFMEKNHWFYADGSFNLTIDRIYKAFMWILIQTYISTGDKVMPIPITIMRDTVDYFNKSNIYLQFVKQCIRKDSTAKGISTYMLFSIYKKWYADNISRYGQVSFPKFIEEMTSVCMIPMEDIYRNISIIYK